LHNWKKQQDTVFNSTTPPQTVLRVSAMREERLVGLAEMACKRHKETINELAEKKHRINFVIYRSIRFVLVN